MVDPVQSIKTTGYNFLFGQGTKYNSAERRGRWRVSKQGTSIIPIAEAWPHVNDSNGVAFPAGLIAVRWRQDMTQTPDTNNGYVTTPGAPPALNYITAVPDTLPSGYSLSTLREHNHRRTRGGIDFSTCAGVNEDGEIAPVFLTPPAVEAAPWIRTAGAVTPYYWMPENSGNYGDYVTTPNNWTWSLDVSHTSLPCTGFRYLRAKWSGTGTSLNRFEFRRNVSGLTGGTGDTVLFSYSNNTNTSDSGLQMHGGANDFYAPTFGTRCNFYWAFEFFQFGTWHAYTQSQAEAAGFNCAMGPRLDIPYPWTVTGAGIVAPGGIVAGAVPGY